MRAVANHEVDAAIVLLETAVSVLPEYTDALALLHAQYVRAGRTEDAMRIALRALVAPPSFGEPPRKVLRWLKSQSSAHVDPADPIWRARKLLTLQYGGVKENPAYPILSSAIDDYLAQADFVSASTLMQTYTELISGETVSFQERYRFDRGAFIARQIEVSQRLAGGSRDTAALLADRRART